MARSSASTPACAPIALDKVNVVIDGMTSVRVAAAGGGAGAHKTSKLLLQAGAGAYRNANLLAGVAPARGSALINILYESRGPSTRVSRAGKNAREPSLARDDIGEALQPRAEAPGPTRPQNYYCKRVPEPTRPQSYYCKWAPGPTETQIYWREWHRLGVAP